MGGCTASCTDVKWPSPFRNGLKTRQRRASLILPASGGLRPNAEMKKWYEILIAGSVVVVAILFFRLDAVEPLFGKLCAYDF